MTRLIGSKGWRSVRLRPAILLALLVGVLALAGSTATPALAVSTTVVISEVYGGAGCGTVGCSTYKNDYIELRNIGTTAISLNGWSVQYAAATGTSWQVTALPNVTLQPGQYFLIAESFNANGVNTLPTPDATGSIAMSATAAKVALVNTTTALSGSCPTSTSIVDLVGYGATASCFETLPAPAPSTTTSDQRINNATTDTDNNSTDFQALAPNPQNTASPTAVTLASFTAASTASGVSVSWQTASEIDMVGFNVYRKTRDEWEKLNAALIPSNGIGGVGTNLYHYLDSSALVGHTYSYRMEMVEASGNAQWAGPITITVTRPAARQPRP